MYNNELRATEVLSSDLTCSYSKVEELKHSVFLLLFAIISLLVFKNLLSAEFLPCTIS